MNPIIIHDFDQTATILLNDGYSSLVSVSSLDLITQCTWYAVDCKWGNIYVENAAKELLHRKLTDCPKGRYVDHIDGDGLNNTLSNLRIVTNQENAFNRVVTANTESGFKGIRLMHTVNGDLYEVTIGMDYTKIRIGRYLTLLEAQQARNLAVALLWGGYGRMIEGIPMASPELEDCIRGQLASKGFSLA